MNRDNEMLCYSKDRAGVYLNVNPGFVASADISSADDALGRNDKALPWSNYSSACLENDGRVMSTGRSHVFIEHSILKGIPVIYRSFKSPLLGHSGKIIGTTGLSIRIHLNALIPLSKQQTACLKQLALGNSYKAIGKAMGISEKTVEHYLDAVKSKLNCHTRAELIMQAIERGLVGIF